MQITRENISSKKAQELRFEKGLCSEELYYALNEKEGLNYLGNFPHDNIDLDLVSRASKPFCIIINTGDQNTKGEHWTAVWASQYNVDYIDLFGLPPLQKDTLALLDKLTSKGTWTCNLEPVQNIMDLNSNACGYHCIYILLNRANQSKKELEDLIKSIYNSSVLNNDTLVTVLCESTLFNN